MTSTRDLTAAAKAMLSAEIGTIYKQAPRRLALLYPSPYRAAMSSLGYQVIYRLVNERPDWSAERAMLPDDVDAYRRSRTPLFTLESQFPVQEAEVVAVSLAYELELAGLLTCLDLAGIPLRAAQRGPGDPLVVIGGPLTFSNPVPAGPFADVVVMGEGEELIGRILDAVADASDRDDALSRLVGVQGIYLPSVHGERLLPVAKAVDDVLPGYGQILTPNTELADMHLVEAERGCHRKCTFCVMRRSTNGGMRLATPDSILATVPEAAKRVGLVGAAVSDHPQLEEIVARIVASGRGVGLSSLRADRLTPNLVGLLRDGGYQTLTVASDGASERIRSELIKVIREEHLFEAARYVREFSLRSLKVYMMVGVPGETEADIDELIEFGRELSKVCRVVFGIAPFVAKRNTPLDRAPFAGVREVDATLKRLARELRGVVDIRPTSARWAWVEWALAQGGFDMADATEQAWREGGGFAEWKRAISEHLREVQPADSELRLGLPTGLPTGRFVADLGLTPASAGPDPQ
ncbi:MAG: radical SAM protein [Myxococcales bacterium]|nr:radical SAM protein [Myxococcales bacterium]